jgi:hypothetical protein
MIEFLSGHFRYDTMNSWNAATSYAANVKLSRLTFPNSEARNRAYDLIQTDEAMLEVNSIIREFDEAHDYEWQAGFNGRSAGYIVLYRGGRKPSEYKRICHDCGQKNFRADSTKCGRCGSENMHDFSDHETFTYPGKGVDAGEDFEGWDTDSLRKRVSLVMQFDRMVERCVAAFVAFCVNHEAEEETYLEPKKRLVAKEIAHAA